MPANAPVPSPDTAKNQLLKAAKTLFARNGLDGTTVRDIAREAETNLCLISYHFGGKEGLYRECIAGFGRQRLMIQRGLLRPVQTAAEFKLILGLVINNIIETFVEDAEMHRILMREFESGLPVAKDVFESTFLVLIKSITGFVKDAQKSGVVREDVDPFYFTTMIYGTLTHVMRMNFIAAKYFNRSFEEPSQRKKLADTILRTVVEGALA